MTLMRSKEDRCCGGGFTLIEMMIVMVLFFILMGSFLMTWLTGQTSYLSSEASVQIQQEARKAFDNIVRELREAGGTVTASASQLDFQIALGYDRIELPGCEDEDNDVCWGAVDQDGTEYGDWSVRYREDGDQLLREVLDSSGTVRWSRVLANYVDAEGTSFAWDSTDRTVTMTFESTYVDSRLPQGELSTGSLASQVTLRNP